jgi:uncharacterized protein (TIGR04255 family)
VDDYKKLENQPLKFVLAEFRFSPVLQIADNIPNIQEALRKQFPIFDKKSEQALNVQSGGIAVSNIESWAFISANKRSAIEINHGRLVYITAEYPRFEGFSAACGQALETLVNLVEPSLLLRIGLRYSDLVTVENGEQITGLVNEHFGLPKCIDSIGVAKQHSTDTILSTDIGRLVIRTLYGESNLICLPDLHGLPISIMVDKTPSERMILDFDHIWEAEDESVNFETHDALEKLSSLHATSREAFWKITTDYARDTKWS